MSRVGRKIIELPKTVKAKVDANKIFIEGPKGKAELSVPKAFAITIEPGNISVARPSDAKSDMALHGLYRSLINNIVIGISQGYSKELEIQGVGYKAQAQGKTLNLNLGFSHQVNFPVPDGLTIKTPRPTQITIEGIDKKLVGDCAAIIRSFYKPEPYKGKGIRYRGEYVRRKAGKAVV